MIDLAGKSALVTGGSRGIGRAIVLALARQGADIAFTYKGNAEAAADVTAAVEALGRQALAHRADVSDPDAAEGFVAAALGAYGRIDILVNNAGITRDDLVMRMSVDAWRDVIDTNLSGTFYAIKAAMRPCSRPAGAGSSTSRPSPARRATRARRTTRPRRPGSSA